MSFIVKICGLSTPEALDVALEAGADMVGFVFFPASPRHIGFEAAKLLGARAASRALKVALTVDAANDMLRDIVDALKPDLLQLHGRETPERVGAIRSRFGLPVMKAIPIAARADLSPVRLYATMADRMLFDARAPREATRPGGLGKPFDWRLLQNLDVGIPFMLSGGLDAGNVAEALQITRAPRRRRLLGCRARARAEGPRENSCLRARRAPGGGAASSHSACPAAARSRRGRG